GLVGAPGGDRRPASQAARHAALRARPRRARRARRAARLPRRRELGRLAPAGQAARPRPVRHDAGGRGAAVALRLRGRPRGDRLGGGAQRRRAPAVAAARRARRAPAPEDRFPVGAAYLGGRSLVTLGAAGWAEELRPGGLARADALLRWSVDPWCATMF